MGNQHQIAETKQIRIKINRDHINIDGAVGILGRLLTTDNSTTATLNELIININWRLFNINKVNK